MQEASSFTAQTMALQRAFESHRPADRRLFEDRYADGFLHGKLRVAGLAARVPGLRNLATRVYDSIGGPGPRPSAIARTRAIDDIVTAAAGDIGQVVILGAGFDCRAHRLPELRDVRTFEVDHPATQRDKRAVMEPLDASGGHVTYVAVDFEHDALDERLLASGFDRSRPTLFLWEGVTNYLTPAAVDETLATIRGIAGAGSTLVFTYIDARALDGSGTFPEAERWVHAVEDAGEPWIFGLDPQEVPSFLSERGYALVSDVSTEEIGAPLFAAQHRRERASALYRVAVAGVGSASPR